jgi:aryl carrier-like protein
MNTGGQPPTSRPTPEDVVDQIGEIVKELLGRHIDPDENLFEAGLNSLTLARLTTLMSKRLGVHIAGTELFGRPNLRGAAALVLAATTTEVQPRTVTAGRADRGGASRRAIRERIRRDGDAR